MNTPKSLDRKLAALRGDRSCREFILADAKDPDMAFGIRSPGDRWPASSAGPQHLSMDEFINQTREIVKQGLVDIMLTSVSTMCRLAHEENVFERSAVTPAIRANDTTDIWLPRGGTYHTQPSRPFATCELEEAQHGCIGTSPLAPRVDLGLYSITFNNHWEADRESLTAFKAFRRACAEHRFRYFLEVFKPNMPGALRDEDVPAFLNDQIVRTLAGIAPASRPQFLKIPYFGPRWMEELVQYDSTLIVGVLGGASGTTADAFHLVHQAKQHGARLALFGRKIKDSEHPLTFVAYLRRVADELMSPSDAVRAYHNELKHLKVAAKRPLEDDLKTTDPVLAA
jgi:hypothetical protein